MKLTYKQKQAIPASKRAGPKGHWPLEDKAHIRSARSYERFASPEEKKKIDAAAKKAHIGEFNHPGLTIDNHHGKTITHYH